jgi:hypothetical protein
MVKRFILCLCGNILSTQKNEFCEKKGRINMEENNTDPQNTPINRWGRPAWLTDEYIRKARENPNFLIEQVSEVISSTDTSISGTVDVYKSMVKDLNDQLIASSPNEVKFQSIMDNISILNTKMEELEGHKEALQKVEYYIKNNLEFIMNATEAKGRIIGVESRIDGLEKRVGYVEDEIKVTKQNKFAVWAIVISIIGIIVSVLIALYG